MCQISLDKMGKSGSRSCDKVKCFVVDKNSLGWVSNNIFSPTGMAQGASLGVAVVVGRKFGNRLLPMVAGKTYTIPFKVANRTLAYSIPWATACAWFETPKTITWSVVSTTGSGIAMTLTGIWSAISFTFSFLWNLMTGQLRVVSSI